MSEPGPRRTRPLVWLAWVGIVGVFVWGLAQALVPDATFPQGAVQVAGDWAFLPALVFGLAAVFGSDRALAGASLSVAALHLGALGLLWGPRVAPQACGPSLRIVSANLLMVHPNPGPLFEELESWDADLYVFQEYSPRWDYLWLGSRLSTTHPYGTSLVREDSFGTAIWSRTPLNAEVFELGGVPQSRARVALGAGQFDVFNVHVLPPRTSEYFPLWRQGLDDLVALAGGDALPFVVTGDFNASPWSKFARDMHGIADDGWELVGAGFGHTWPNGVFLLPPARIDHVFVSRGLTVNRFVIGDALGSDHAPLQVEVAPRVGGVLCVP